MAERESGLTPGLTSKTWWHDIFVCSSFRLSSLAPKHGARDQTPNEEEEVDEEEEEEEEPKHGARTQARRAHPRRSPSTPDKQNPTKENVRKITRIASENQATKKKTPKHVLKNSEQPMCRTTFEGTHFSF